jgi:glycosyltransferase involved in cell wall biosynthesis
VISIIIPFLNAESWLAGAVESVLAQTGVEAEIVCVDDGSTDGSLDIARRFEPALRVVVASHGGVSAARNRGISETSGEWLVFLDADDLLRSGTLRCRLDTASSSGTDVVICDWQELIDNGTSEIDGPIRAVEGSFCSNLRDALELACATDLWAPTAAVMYRRGLIQRIGGFRCDLPIIQDARFLFDAARHGARFARAPHLGARYRVRPQSLSRRDPGRFWRDVLLNGTQIEALWRAHGRLAAEHCAALAGIYNGAAQGLFRSRDPVFRDALAALRASALPIDRRNRAAELLSDIGGQPMAVRLAELWTLSRRALRRAAGAR